MNDECKPQKLGLEIAHLMRRGLVAEAHELAFGRVTWTSEEARAILDAGLSLRQFGVTNGFRVAMSVLGWE